MKVLYVVLALLVGVMIAATAWGQDPTGKYANSPYHEWFKAQMSEPGFPWPQPFSCCDIADAHPAEVMSLGGGKYAVKIDGQYVPYPGPVNPYYENPTGKDWVWYHDLEEGHRMFWCLRLSTGS